jgi:menaquinone-specific isochorismate synthase
MKVVSLPEIKGKSKKSLLKFFQKCLQEAKKDQHFKIASISLVVPHIDPLALLESIYQPTQYHFYLEHPVEKEAIVGIESILSKTFTGAKRFQQARGFAQHILKHTIVIGHLDQPFSGPNFLSAFTFFDQTKKNATFSPATLFVPRLQIARKHGVYTAVVNVLITPLSNVETLTQKVWDAHQKFSSFNHHRVKNTNSSFSQELKIKEKGGEHFFINAVKSALKSINSQKYEKIVLARAFNITAKQPFHPIDTLNQLRSIYSSSYCFSFSNQNKQCFMGATPELLVRIYNNQLKTEAIAGSAPRGIHASHDAYLAKTLLENPKNCTEHQIVVDGIIRQLKAISINPQTTTPPQLLQLSNVQHLRSSIHATIPLPIHIMDIVASLHPTPAIAGSPKETVLNEIQRIENFERGLYGGTIGYFDARGNGKYIVAIRSALINGKRAQVYAGSGIIAGSEPDKEKQETDLKLKTILHNLC